MTSLEMNQGDTILTASDLRRALERPLPGLSAQLKMAPAYRIEALRNRAVPADAKDAGVMILFYPHRDELFFPLTKRTESLESHKGQISLPGGACEGDETTLAAAFRETCEELGVCPDTWEILGRLTSLYIPPSGFLVAPYITFCGAHPSFCPDPSEVAELIETPLSLLLQPKVIVWEEWTLQGNRVMVPYFNIYGHTVWGATAMILSELIYILGELKPTTEDG
jgi:8-oxo-dGTP pyrophosphatase MutT (NUDIX family)